MCLNVESALFCITLPNLIPVSSWKKLASYSAEHMGGFSVVTTSPSDVHVDLDV